MASRGTIANGRSHRILETTAEVLRERLFIIVAAVGAKLRAADTDSASLISRYCRRKETINRWRLTAYRFHAVHTHAQPTTSGFAQGAACDPNIATPAGNNRSQRHPENSKTQTAAEQSHIPSPGSNNTGTRFIVAAAAPVIMFVAPGPMELVQTIVRRRLLILAEAAEVCTMACSLRAS